MSKHIISIPTSTAGVIYQNDPDRIEHDHACDKHEVTWPVTDYDESGSPICGECGEIINNTGMMSIDLGQLDLETLKQIITTSTEAIFHRLKGK